MEFTKEEKLFQDIVNKAWEDDVFMKDLLSNPEISIEKLTGQKTKISEGKTLVVCDQTDSSKVYINIPAKPTIEDLQLSEEQLETISGGSILDVIADYIKSKFPPIF